MKIIEIDLNNVPANDIDLTLCLGYFDGVHLGHQQIIHNAKKEGLPVAVLSFDNSPSHFLGLKDEKELTTLADKAYWFNKFGVDIFYIMHFDKETLKVTKDEFINVILKKINPKKIFCGVDYRFGVRGEGTPEYLNRFFPTHAINLLKEKDLKISSTQIREYVTNGPIESANEMLGRPYRLIGMVVEGNHMGRTIQFPTANLELDGDYVLPLDGVYAGKVRLHDEYFKCLVSIGRHPTIYGLEKSVVEVNILDFDRDIYGTTIYVDLLTYIRGVIKFESMEDLKHQIEKDREFAKKTLK